MIYKEDFIENGKSYRLIKQGPDLASPEGVTVAVFHKRTRIFRRLLAPGDDEESVIFDARAAAKEHATRA